MKLENQDDALAEWWPEDKESKPNIKGSSGSEGTQENLFVVMPHGNTGLMEWGRSHFQISDS